MVPSSDALGDSLREVKRMPAVEASGSLGRARFPGDSSSFWEQEMWSRSTQTELENESSTQTESQAYFTCDTFDQNEEPRYTLQRMTGSSWSPNTFLASLDLPLRHRIHLGRHNNRLRDSQYEQEVGKLGALPGHRQQAGRSARGCRAYHGHYEYALYATPLPWLVTTS
ncbi:hypothetical protein MTO96_016175 [Rhipicephalus appendiculatus]